LIAEDNLDLLKKDASQSLIQLLESAAKEAEKSSNYEVEKSGLEMNEIAASIDIQVPNKIKDEVAKQMVTANLVCLVCNLKYKNANELSQHLQVIQ